MTESGTEASAAFAALKTALAGRYELEREIGAGGMATVFLARDVKHGRDVAVKVLREELSSSVSAERFIREVQIASGLAHPHILPVHDSGAAGGILYFVMPYVEGESIAARIERSGPFGISESTRIIGQAGAALQHAHDHGLVHRDVKPANILLSGGIAVVADFGIAKAVEPTAGEERLTSTGVGLGTPSYMSPEQATDGAAVDHRADQYSLACTLFEMLTGQPPFPGPTFRQLVMQHLSAAIPQVSKVRTEIPLHVERALVRAMAKEPAHRFPSVGEFVDAVEGRQALGGRVVAWMQSRRARRVMGAAAAGVVAVVLAIVAAGGGRSWFTSAAPERVLDENRVAVAPFGVFSPTLELWREGLVDILSRDLDGAGPLRTVAPSVVIRLFTGRTDAASAASLARSTGAGLVVLGQLETAGSDSVRATVTLIDAMRGDSTIGAVEVREDVARMDRLADSIAVRLLRVLGQQRAIAAVPRTFFGSRSLTALKAFLQGEQFYRRNEFAEARALYERTLELDSTFVMAARRMRGVLRGQGGGEMDALSLEYALRAGRNNRRLAPRDSLLVVADSLLAAHGPEPTLLADAAWLALLRRRFDALESAARLYPEDPEVWTELGEARTHFGHRVGVDDESALAAFERALAADSVYGPAFFHLVDLGLVLREDRVLLPVVERYLRFNPTDRRFDLARRVLAGESVDRLRRWMGALPPDERGWPVLTLFRRRLDSPDVFDSLHVTLLTRFASTRQDSASAVVALRARRSYRGRIRDAGTFVDAQSLERERRLLETLGAMVDADVVTEAQALAAVDAFIAERDVGRLPYVLGWLAARRDTVRLSRAVAAVAMGSTIQRGADLAWARYLESLAQGYLVLAEGDSAAAAARFLSLPDSLAPSRYLSLRVEVAELLVALGRDREAAAYLDRRPPDPIVFLFSEVRWRYARAGVAGRLGDHATAVRHYTLAMHAWQHADAELQPLVATARAALRRLGGRGR